MSGVIIEPFTSIESAERNFSRLNEAIVALQGGSIAIENIEGYENLATKEDLEDAVEELQYKVGDVHISESEENPADKFGYGEWEIISRGRVLAGIDVPPEDEPEYEPDQDFQTPGQEGGEKEHTLTIDEMPEHEHGYQTLGTGPRHLDGENGDLARNGRTDYETDLAGGGEAHNNLQPYYCVYIWKRTA